ncbi:MAG: hypothetical protein U0Z17_06885 [Bacteroidales bacterium]
MRHRTWACNFKNLVDLLGGNIGMESNPGKGSLFYFNIPYKPAKKQPAKELKTDFQFVNWSGKTILIAEDTIQLSACGGIAQTAEYGFCTQLMEQIAVDIVRAEPNIDLI